jgi:23S rRNA (cytosine1962-C5)-methyltransferase
MAARPLIRLNPHQERRLKAGHPWAYSNEIRMTPELRGLTPGLPVRLEGDDGWRGGTFAFNPHSLIAARLLDRDPEAAIDGDWIRRRIAAAAALRARVADRRFHRLVHAEADGLPGLVVDRYGEVAVVAANSAWADGMTGEIVAALIAELGLAGVVGRNDSPVRELEGLPQAVALLAGQAGRVAVEEGGLRFGIDLMAGQKTGWFFDQRRNRDMVAALAAGARVLDAFCHLGAFGLRCAAAGATSVTLIDSSAAALAGATEAAAENGLAGRVAMRRGDALEAMAEAGQAGERYDIVVCDPPAFAKSRKDQAAGLRAYGRMARLAARLVAPGGLLFVASCSYHAPLEAFAAAVAEGLHRARREGRVLATTGAGPDHPVHPHLPESAYLKAQLIQLD